MEQPNPCECHDHIVAVTAFDDRVVADRSAGFCNIAHAAFSRALNVVAEWEERVRAERNAVDSRKISADLFLRERVGALREVFLPVAVGADILFVFVDISVDDVVPIGSAERGKEGECKHLFVLTKKPRIRFAARETGAVDSGLLSCANADCLPVECVANRVRLRVFERNQGDQQVADGVISRLFLPCSKVIPKTCLRSVSAGTYSGSICTML